MTTPAAKAADSILVGAPDLPEPGPTGFPGARYYPGAIFPGGSESEPTSDVACAYVLRYLRSYAPYGSSLDAWILGLSPRVRRNAVRSLYRRGALVKRYGTDGGTVWVAGGTIGETIA